jgi:uncharacterized protein YlxP (DUF503 family)
MIIFSYEIHAYIPECHSLKEKRGVLKSFMARVQHKYNISIAEIGLQDTWQSAEIGLVWVTSDKKVGSQMLEKMKIFISNEFPNIYIEKENLEIL